VIYRVDKSLPTCYPRLAAYPPGFSVEGFLAKINTIMIM
jgi:hypothetical protein